MSVTELKAGICFRVLICLLTQSILLPTKFAEGQLLRDIRKKAKLLLSLDETRRQTVSRERNNIDPTKTLKKKGSSGKVRKFHS